jgi:D-tyrosyl-tRNA(Tyr) deacylase
MKFLIQRVLNAQVDIDGETVGKIGKGYMILIGVGEGDSKEIADRYIRKMLALSIFADENGKTNL